MKIIDNALIISKVITIIDPDYLLDIICLKLNHLGTLLSI